jgi:riboflavin kinase/FMN adenylyltransferase
VIEDKDRQPCVATIGFFDGVHRGHQFLIDEVKTEAAKAGLQSLVITFDRHPRQVLQQSYQPQLLTTLDEKLRLLSLTGIDDIYVLHFTQDMAALTAKEFMSQILHDKLQVRKLVIGYDNRFGHNRTEGFDDYVQYGRDLGIEVIQAHPFEISGVKVSSSVVRAFLNGGEVEMAKRCLGRPFMLSGTVVRGFQEGRKMGFPTANLQTAEGLLIPADGVYAVKVKVCDTGKWLPAMTNIGTRPTFHGTARTLETHIFDFDRDIYGAPMTVGFIRRIRGERMFDGEQALAEQLRKDEQEIRKILKQ